MFDSCKEGGIRPDRCGVFERSLVIACGIIEAKIDEGVLNLLLNAISIYFLIVYFLARLSKF